MTFNPILEMARLYKKYLKHCQRKNIKPLPKECMSIDILNRIINEMVSTDSKNYGYEHNRKN
jgi:hypothetical protein